MTAAGRDIKGERIRRLKEKCPQSTRNKLTPRTDLISNVRPGRRGCPWDPHRCVVAELKELREAAALAKDAMIERRDGGVLGRVRERLERGSNSVRGVAVEARDGRRELADAHHYRVARLAVLLDHGHDLWCGPVERDRRDHCAENRGTGSGALPVWCTVAS